MASSSTTKLTLSVPIKLVKAAKSYSNKTKKPLSQLISQYFAILTSGFDIDDVPEKIAKVTGLASSPTSDDELLLTAMKDKYLK